MSSSGLAQQQSRLKELISRGREQGYLTYAEVNDHLPDEITDPEQIEDIIGMINDMGIAVHESAPDSDELLQEGDSTDELAAEEAADAQSESESLTELRNNDNQLYEALTLLRGINLLKPAIPPVTPADELADTIALQD